MSDTFTSMFTSQLATFNERKIAIAETRHTGGLTVILGSSRPLLRANKNYSPADVLNLIEIKDNLFSLTTTTPQSECHEKVYLRQLLKFCTLLKIVPCTDFSRVASGLEINNHTRCL